MLGVALGLGCSLCWGISDFVGALSSRRMPVLRVLGISQPVGLVIAVAVVVIAAPPAPSVPLMGLVAACGAITVGALGMYYLALALGPIGVVAPIGAMGVALPVAVGLLSGDRPAAIQVGGIALAVAGVVLSTREGASGVPVSIRALMLAGLAAVGFGSFLVVVDAASRLDPLWVILAVRVGTVTAIGAWALARRDSSRSEAPPASELTRSDRLGLAALGAFDLGANLAYAAATRHGELAVVAVSASLYPAVAAVLAWVVVGERLGRSQRVGVIGALVGVSMIAAGA